MNFKIFDDEFEDKKQNYLQEIENLSKNVITPEKKKQWNDFVNKVLVDTRSYYILIYALKVMQNLENQKNFSNADEYFNNALINAMMFMPDKTFIETAILIVSKFHRLGMELAKNQNVDIDLLFKDAKKQEKISKVNLLNKSVFSKKNLKQAKKR